MCQYAVEFHHRTARRRPAMKLGFRYTGEGGVAAANCCSLTAPGGEDCQARDIGPNTEALFMASRSS
jgi:hypothetical protein